MGALDAAGIHFQTMRRGTSTPGPRKRGNTGISARPLCSRPEGTTPRCNFSISCTFLNVGGLMRLATCLADQTGKCCGKPNAELNKSLLVGEARPRLAPNPTSESRSRGPVGSASRRRGRSQTGAEPDGDVAVTKSCDQTCFPVWESKYYCGEQERRPSLSVRDGWKNRENKRRPSLPLRLFYRLTFFQDAFETGTSQTRSRRARNAINKYIKTFPPQTNTESMETKTFSTLREHGEEVRERRE